MYTLKSIAKRGATLSAAFVLVVSSLAASAAPAFADELNPLTERSLTLSSSSPGWAHTDGSGNSTYAPPNSGANGQKTGNYFDFKVSSTATVKTFSFQYCTFSAGDCITPGNDSDPGTDDPANQQADLNVHYTAGNDEVGDTDFDTVVAATGANKGSVKAVPGYTNNNPKYSGTGDPAEAAKAVAGHYIVMYYDPTGDSGNGEWKQSTGWSVEAHKVTTDATRITNNYITLTNSTGVDLTAGQRVKVLFFATDDDYITNPGSGAFFVKINTYGKDFVDTSPTTDQLDLTGLAPATNDNVIDGGVTVANVMNESIQITTKVLETMQFSVGTVDPDTLSSTDGTDGTTLANSSTYEKALGVTPTTDGDDNTVHKKHGTCDTIAKAMTPSSPQNVLQLGNQSAESSLETDKAYATHSYWRLSSNSSAGATVYYSGHTLSNTSGDEIQPIGTTAAQSAPGSEQFGLAIAQASINGGHDFDTATHGVSYATAGAQENAADNSVTGVDNSTLTDLGADLSGTPSYTALNKSFHLPQLNPLDPVSAYANGVGTITSGGSALFAFDSMSDTVPTPIADESSEVVDCVTAKMRYIGNIAATTPAGIYTTKINYIAAPQY